MKYSTEDIDKYLLDELSIPERENFINAMKQDSSFKSLVEEREIELGIINHHNHQLKNRLQKIQDEVGNPISNSPEQSDAKKQNNSNLWKWIVAALILSALAFALFKFVAKEEIKKDPNLYAQHYSFYNPKLTQRSQEDNQTLKNLNAYINAKDYTNSIPVLEEFLDENSNANLEILLANCYMQMGNFEDAKSNLLKAQTNALYKDEAAWYLALLAIKDNKMSDARQLLFQLSENGPQTLKVKAKALLEDLN